MKHLKKLASVLLALSMVLALAVPAWASSTSGTNVQKGKITIDNAIPGQTYGIYKIFDLESFSNVTTGSDPDIGTVVTNGNFSYKVVDAWKPFFAAGGLGAKYIEVDTDGYISVNHFEDETNIPDAAQFAKDALTWAKSQNPPIEVTETKNAPEAEEATTTSVEFPGLDLGYYLVDSSAGALCSLNTTATDVVIKEKNKLPTLDKEVKEGDNWQEENDANVGDTVEFRTTIHAKPGAENYVLHDKMNATQLAFDTTEGIQVYTKVGNGEETLVATNSYELITTGDDLTHNNNTCTFHVTFIPTFLNTITQDTDIIVYYQAEILPGAVVAGTGNENDTWLDYGDDQETEHDTTRTYTYEFDLVKTDGDDKLLSGAEFSLYTEAAPHDNQTALWFTLTDGVYKVCKAGTASATQTIAVSDGKVKISGLDTDTYYLWETKAPEGYNALTEHTVIMISAIVDSTTHNAVPSVAIGNDVTGGDVTATVDTDNDTYTSGGVRVTNLTGTQLPETGGIGTTIFYIVGGVLLVGAVVLLIAKRRTSADEE